MNIKYLSHKLLGLAFVAMMLTGITIFSTTNAQAQRRFYRPVRVYRPYYGSGYGFGRPFGWGYGWNNGFYGDSFYNPYSQYVFTNSESAADHGYDQGFKTGKDDGKKNKSFSFERSHYYQEAGFGNFGEVYRRNFARGYQSGYRDSSDS